MKMVSRALLFFIPFSFGVATAATVCESSIGGCDYYRCRESFQACGERGYLLNFGAKYCDRFEERVRPKVTAAGAAWLPRVAACLQQSLDALPLSASCDETRQFAIETHAACYVGTGFCSLSPGDWLKVIRTVYREGEDPKVRAEFREIVHGCRNRPAHATGL